jgi:mannose-1-phosphate guanylyltransferase/phosphomannomutase
MVQLAAIVPVVNAQLGVRIDIAGEKVLLVDDEGRRLTGLETLAAATEMIFACYGKGTVAVPVTAPSAFEEIARRHGGCIVRTRANPSAMTQYAANHRDFLLLGDAAGNLIFPSFYPTVDGLFAIVKFMELIALQQVKLSSVVANLPQYHMAHTKVACRWENKGKVMRILNERYTDQRSEQIDGVRIEVGDEWVLIRPDPDGPFFYVTAEGASDALAQALTEKYAGLVTNLQ